MWGPWGRGVVTGVIQGLWGEGMALDGGVGGTEGRRGCQDLVGWDRDRDRCSTWV